MAAINLDHEEGIIYTDGDGLLKITEKGAIVLGKGTYLDEMGNPAEIPVKEEYKGALRYNEDKGILQYCDGLKWRDINGQYKQISQIVWSLLF